MAETSEKALHVRVRFPDRKGAAPVFRALEKDTSLSATILRARVTPADAWFELELAGSARNVENLLRLSVNLGAGLDLLPALS